ncbi:MAG: tetratricopeptide repeat protein [Thermoleophilia bacterium]|nr:tetratricopeptide repeat protein [Thermoleophilia bacterium]
MGSARELREVKRLTEFRLLGPLEVIDDGRALPLGSGRQRTLLCLLLLCANELVTRDVLIDRLWGEHPPATAANALQVQVHALRRLLGPERIATDGPGYRLELAPHELDSSRFERLTGRGRSELSAGKPEAAAAALREALALWRGPALADVAYESFAQAEIARLDEARLVALELRLEADLALAGHHEVIPELEALVQAHPLRERLHEQLMLALYRAGRQADALSAFRRARRAMRDELGLEPGPDLRELQQAILRQDAALRVEPPELRARRHLPAPSTPLVGRGRELAELGALIRGGDVRLVTLTGPGGTGKTRLALKAAHELADVFPDGVYFVDLSPLRDPSLVPSTIAHALGLPEQIDRPVAATLLDHVRGHRLALVLDNFEVVDGAAPMLADLLRAGPDLALLVTSRAPLRLSGEHVYRVPPLPPGDAVRLFVARARAVAPSFRRASEESAEVAAICERLDRLPLAIELAAARSRELAPAEMLSMRPSGLELASGGDRDLPERHQALRSTIDWSFALLEPAEQRLLASLGVFVGGCTRAAAEAICEASRASLASLVARSLLQERPGKSGEVRFSLLETMREYCLERLTADDLQTLRERHAAYYLALAETAEPKLLTPEQLTWLELLEEDHDNFRAIFSREPSGDHTETALRLGGALAHFWAVRDHFREGRARLAAALEEGAGLAASVRAKALAGACVLALRLGDYAAVRSLAEEGLALCRATGDEAGIALALDRLATVASFEGDFARSEALYRESAGIWRALDHRRGLAGSLSNLGALALMAGDYESVRRFSEEAVALYRDVQRDGMSAPLSNLGHAARLQGRQEESRRHFCRCVDLARELGYTEALIYCIEGLAAVLAESGEEEAAATLLGASSAQIEATGVSLEPFEGDIHRATVEHVKEVLGEVRFEAAWAGGRSLTADEAAAYAVGAERATLEAEQPEVE